MSLKKGDVQNFNTLKQAFNNGEVALMECKDAKTGEYRAVICAAYRDVEGHYNFVPFAEMCTENPFTQWTPPEEMKDVVITT